MSANVWLYFLIPVIINDAENEIDNIDEISLFDEGNQHVLELNGNLLNINANNSTIWKVEDKFKEVATELLKNWEERQTKKIYKLQLLALSMKSTIKILFSMELCSFFKKKVISSLPQRQK